jgi:signal transduction histidine kinase
VDVNGSIDETLLLMGKQLSKDGVQMSVSLDRTLGAVLGDTNALQQVLINLLLNARDAMPRGGEVRIETAREPDRAGWLRLTVADTGEGMGSDELARIWEAFYTTKTAGTGLGLSVSHKIIREHGGAVAVQSEPGHGTTFVILLPMVA